MRDLLGIVSLVLSTLAGIVAAEITSLLTSSTFIGSFP